MKVRTNFSRSFCALFHSFSYSFCTPFHSFPRSFSLLFLSSSRTFFALFLFFSLLFSCSTDEKKFVYQELQGNAQGTTFTIKFGSKDTLDVSDEISNILARMDSVFSSYVEYSTINKINNYSCEKTEEKCTVNVGRMNKDIERVLNKSLEIYEFTSGAFNPAIMPLVRYWGFGPEEIIPEKVDSIIIDSLLKFTDFTEVAYDMENGGLLISAGMKLDFNAIAQGYTVDLIAEYFESKGIKNYMVELGGEVRATGVNNHGKTWTIGIDKPVEGNDDHQLHSIVTLDGRSLATSGNYRKYYEKDGKKFHHTIDPSTGYPARHNLLSVSVVAPDCASADAYATAFMVMGLEKAKNLIESKQKEIDALLIYSDENGNLQSWMSKGMKNIVKEQE